MRSRIVIGLMSGMVLWGLASAVTAEPKKRQTEMERLAEKRQREVECREKRIPMNRCFSRSSDDAVIPTSASPSSTAQPVASSVPAVAITPKALPSPSRSAHAEVKKQDTFDSSPLALDGMGAGEMASKKK